MVHLTTHKSIQPSDSLSSSLQIRIPIHADIMKNEFARLILYTSLVGSFGLSYGMLTEHTSGADGGNYHGRYTLDIRNPELLIPRRITEDGSFLTFDLPNFYDLQELERRKKRAADSNAVDDLADHKLHLVLPFNSLDHHVELTPNHDFISSDLVVETRGDGALNDGIRFKRVPEMQCHYRGHVRGHDNSRAALSLCEGVAGYVQTDHGRFFIEPLKEAVPDEAGQHVHMVYKREVLNKRSKKHLKCATKNNWETAWAEQIKKKNLRDRMIANETLSKRASSATHSVHRYLELGVFCDKRFLVYHNGTDYEQYVLTIMNMVFDLYHDASVGNQMDVVVVRIVYLEKQEKEIDLLVSTDAVKTLDSFSAWQHQQNPSDPKHPNHHDIGVLITRYDICAGTDEPCSVQGIAATGSACDSPNSACLVEDSGLDLGVSITHEIGHTLGCGHDDVDLSGCSPTDKDGSDFVMSPYGSIFTYKWSTCSRKFITTFMESGLGDCLVNNPKKPNEKYKFPEMLPGAMYDGQYQCNMAFPKSILCAYGESICEHLWCRKKGKKQKCLSKAPPADGTKCAENKWCIHHKCVEIGERPAAVHGGWGKWGGMSECSRTCGGGVSFAGRECDNPPPENGGRYCMGERKKFTICNTAPCDENKPPFRNVQCSAYDNVNVMSDGDHKWTPVPFHNKDIDICALFCINENSVWAKLAPMVKDGTPCKSGTNNMCISGVCRNVGCDWQLDSDVLEDQCGICGGSGTECTLVEGDYTDTGKSDYQKIITVPKGSRNIKVIEKKPCKNTLAIKLEKSDTYILNGGHRLQRIGEYPCAGDIAIYNHPEEMKEEISIKGPIKEAIQLQYAFYNPNENPGIHWAYFTSSGKFRRYSPQYVWDFLDWGPCSTNCGGGTQIAQASCIEHLTGRVSNSFCKDMKRPEPKSRICNATPCYANWRVSQWSECSACGGKQGEQRRKVQCVKPASRSGGEEVEVELSACKDKAPRQSQSCKCSKPCKKRSAAVTQGVVFGEGSDANGEDVPSLQEQENLIDKVVDKGMPRYLEKPNAAHGEGSRSEKRNVASDSDSLLDDRAPQSDDADLDDEESYPKVAAKDPANLKRGSIVEDVVRPGSIVLMEAPYIPIHSNLSDQAYQEDGDIIDTELETDKMKTYTGAEAINRIHSSDQDDSESFPNNNRTSEE